MANEPATSTTASPGASNNSQRKATHYVKFEACLCWPDGATRTAFNYRSEIRLYRKVDLQPLVDKCKREERPLSWYDIVNDSSLPDYVARTYSDEKTGYFFFDEEGSSGNIKTIEQVVDWFAKFKRISAWPTTEEEHFYIAVEGCIVTLPLWRAVLQNGTLVKVPEAQNTFADHYFIEAGSCGCCIEISIKEQMIQEIPTITWSFESAFANNGTILTNNNTPYYRDVLAQDWTYRKNEIWPGEAEKRQVGIPCIHVLPLAVYDTTERIGGPDNERWSYHSRLSFTVHADVDRLFNLPAPAACPSLAWGLNTNSEGKPERSRMFPRAIIDLSGTSKRAEVLDNVHVHFFEFGLKVSNGNTANSTLRSFAFGGRTVAQVPFGDAVCLSYNEGVRQSRIKKFSGEGFTVISPIMPQYTQHVLSRELYEPLRNVSGGRLVGGVMVDYRLNRRPDGSRIGGVAGNGNINAAFQYARHHLWAPDVSHVLRLFNYHRDYFKVGGTAGVFSSNRGNHQHHGLDLHNFCYIRENQYGPEPIDVPNLQGEPMYAMRRGRLRFRFSTNMHNYYCLIFKHNAQWRQIDFMHAFTTKLDSMQHLISGDNPTSQLVWAGTFFAWSGSSGNAQGWDVPSKHLHMYYHAYESEVIPNQVSDSKVDPARLFQANVTCAANLQQRNHYPWIRGRILNEHDCPFKPEYVKIIAYDASPGMLNPLESVDHNRVRILAITTPYVEAGNNCGAFDMYIPADTPFGLVITRAYCSCNNESVVSDCNEDRRIMVPLVADVNFNSAAGGVNIGTIKLSYKQVIRGRIVNQQGAGMANQMVKIIDVDSSRLVCQKTTNANGEYSCGVPAGALQVKVGTQTITVPARAIGSDAEQNFTV